MSMSRRKELTKKVLCGLLTASVIGTFPGGIGTAVAANIQEDNLVSKDIVVATTDDVVNGDTIDIGYSGDVIVWPDKGMDITIDGDNTSINTTGDIDANNIIINSNQINYLKNLKANDITINRGHLVADGNVTANNITAHSKDYWNYSASNGNINIGQYISVSANTLESSGTIDTDDIKVTGTGKLKSTGEVKADNEIDVTSGTLVAEGTVDAKNVIVGPTGKFSAAGKVTADKLHTFDRGEATLSGGATLARLSVYDNSVVTLTGGSDKTYVIDSITNDATVNVKDGATLKTRELTVTEDGEAKTVKVSSGAAFFAAGKVTADELQTYDRGEATLSGGATLARLDAGYNSVITLTGGSDKTYAIDSIRDYANINVKDGVNVKANTVTLIKGTVAVADSSSLETHNMNVKGDSTVTGSATVTDTLTIEDGKVLNVGTSDQAGQIVVNKLSGGTVFLDPDWSTAGTDTIEKASRAAVEDVTSINSNLIAGRNSKISLGTKNFDGIDAAFAKTGETWGKNNITAAVYVDSNATLGTGSITANGSLTKAPATAAAAGSVNFADNSILMVDGDKIHDKAAISGVKSATVADSSKLFIDNAKKNETYRILDYDASESGATVWKDGNVISTNSLLRFTGINKDGDSYVVNSSVRDFNDIYDHQIASNVYNKALRDPDNPLSDFALDVASGKIHASKEAQEDAFNSPMSMSEQAGVSHSTYAVSNLLTDAVADHMSLASKKDHDRDVWAKYIHNKENISGLNTDNIGATYDAQYNGLIIGTDLYKNGKATIGAALTYVDGSISGNTLTANSRNEAKYYGASIYGGIQNEDSAVLGDITYLHGSHDISQYNTGHKFTGDTKSDAFGFGVRAEKSFKAGAGKLVPYAGLRYMHLGTGNYTNNYGVTYDADNANLWLLPVGLKYSADIKSGSCIFRPVAEVGYVWNMGDRRANQTVSYAGAVNSFGYDIADSGSWVGHLGFEVQKDSLTYSLGFEYQKGSSVKSNRWMASVNWSF